MAAIDEKEDTFYRNAAFQIIMDELGPDFDLRFRDSCIAIAWHIHDIKVLSQTEEVEALRASWGMGNTCQALTSEKSIDKTGFANIGVACKSNFRKSRLWKIT